MNPTAQRNAGCPSAFELEAFFAGESAVPTAHVSTCAACTAYVSALREGHDAFARARPPELFLKQVERRAAATPSRRRSWMLAPLGLAAAVAAALVLFVVPRGAPSDITLKGTAFRVLVKRGSAEPTALAPDAQVSAGDVLRFSYDAARDGQLAVVDLDGTQRATAFYPQNGARSVAVIAGADPLLPGAIVLDAAPGPEWLVAIYAPTPFELEPLMAQLRGQAGRTNLELKCDGCRIQTLRMQRAPK